MGASINVGTRPERGGFNMSLLALQVAPDAWWSAYLWALYQDRISEDDRTRLDRRHSNGFMAEE